MNVVQSQLRLFTFSVLAAFLFAPSFAFADNPPYAQTFPATKVTEKGVQLNGKVNPRITPDTIQWFEWGIAGLYETAYETYRSSMWSGSDVFSDTYATLYNLAPQTQYWYRQVAENSRGKDKGSMLFFTTKEAPAATGAPVIAQTGNPRGITETSAALTGTVSPHGQSSVKWWVEFGISQNSLSGKTTEQTTGGDTKSVEHLLSGLSSGTTYYYRVAAQAPSMTSYGATLSFTTLGVKSVVPSIPGYSAMPSGNSAAPITSTVGGGGSSPAEIVGLEQMVIKLQAEVARLTKELERELARRGLR